MMIPAFAVIRNWPTVNLVFDGNSLVAGVGASNASTTTLPAQVAALAPVSGAITANNLGASGQTYRMMDGLDGGSSSDVDGAFVAGKSNVLVVWEGTNAICNAGQTATQAIASLGQYAANRRVAHPGWILAALTCVPRGQGNAYGSDQASINAMNAALQAHDDLLRAQYRALGISRLVDVRQAGSPFSLPDYTSASFAALGVDGTTGLWSSQSGPYIHLSDAGYAVVAGYVAAQLRRMPVR